MLELTRRELIGGGAVIATQALETSIPAIPHLQISCSMTILSIAMARL